MTEILGEKYYRDYVTFHKNHENLSSRKMELYGIHNHDTATILETHEKISPQIRKTHVVYLYSSHISTCTQSECNESYNQV